MNKDNYLDREKALANAQKKFAKVKWPCMCPKCADKAINSIISKWIMWIIISKSILMIIILKIV